jgi:hypothetical protein
VWQGSAGDRRPYADQVDLLRDGIDEVFEEFAMCHYTHRVMQDIAILL